MCDEANRQPEVAVEFAHPLAVAAGKVVIDRDHVDALARECVEVDRRRRDERLALAGTHLGDAPLVEADAADQLYVKMPHAEHAARGLTHDRERLGEDLLHRLPLREPLTEFLRIARQFVIGEVHHRRLERVDLLHDAAVARDLLVVVVAEESLENRRYAEQIFHTPVLLVIINRLKDSIRFIITQSPRLCIINVAEGGLSVLGGNTDVLFGRSDQCRGILTYLFSTPWRKIYISPPYPRPAVSSSGRAGSS